MGMFDGARPAGREHIPIYPIVYRILRAAILLVTLIVLGLDAYGLYYLPFSGNSLMMFTCVASLVTSIYFLVSYFFAPAAFNYWALLSLDILNVIFWLVSFALLASQVAPLMDSGTECYYSYCYSYGLYGSDLTFAQCLLAAAGLGGLCFLLYTIVLVLDSLTLVSHHRAGYHSQAGTAQDPEKAAAAAAAAAASSTPAPIAQPSAVPLQNVAPVPYYEQQAAAQQQVHQQVQQPFYGAPTPSAPTPVSYVQSPASSNGGAYYAQPPQQVPHQVPQQVPQQVQHQVQQPPAQYYEAAAAPVQPHAQPQQ